MIDYDAESAGATHAVDFRAWLDIIYRSDLDKVSRHIAEVMALCGDSDGTHIFPGHALVTFRTGYTYNTVQEKVNQLERKGLLFLVKAGAGRHRGDGSGRSSNEYRLIQDPFKLDRERVTIMSPSEATAAVDAIRESKQGKYKADMHPVRRGALLVEGPVMLPVEQGAEAVTPVDNVGITTSSSVDNPTLVVDSELMHPVSSGALIAAEAVNAPSRAGAFPINAPRLILQKPVMHPAPPGATEVLTPTSTTDRPNPSPLDLRTDLKVSREASENPKIDSLPVRCQHKLKARHRADGLPSCVLCRLGASVAPDALGATG